MTAMHGWLRLGLATVVLVLVGACLFGLWHVLVGGLVNGNSRAALFGAVLAGVSASFLAAVLGAIARRSGRA
jgi:uncharacterized membrane protein YhiD involved in acid resistance